MNAAIPSMAGLFSPHVATAWGVPGEWKATPHRAEMSHVADAVEARRLEFVAGRTLARRALAQLGVGDVAIPVGPRREPEWPPGITGSISHTKGYCGVAVARRSDVRGLGFDVERIADVSPQLSAQIVSSTEMLELRRVLGGEIGRALALAFSCKEAFFKYQYPLSRSWVELLDVQVRADADGFLIIPSMAIPNVCARGEALRGRYRFRGDHVLAGIEVAAREKP